MIERRRSASGRGWSYHLTQPGRELIPVVEALGYVADRMQRIKVEYGPEAAEPFHVEGEREALELGQRIAEIREGMIVAIILVAGAAAV